ncbi:MAG: Flp pilus assembly complex ATPase component TadA [Burkholderiales bacterium]|nr:Flp pilus assembly complex ATPase component TadA [Burkholderiales bacterium]
MTIEDPVEYVLPGISQVQVNEKQGLSFADALRLILRQDRTWCWWVKSATKKPPTSPCRPH